ncbi:MAG TPA: PEP-CTERM-box response regulator transcription factor [Verrucomicrobiae bacterium]|nr:PEP-CTERM-box response regulator transcription factor [Verrucomicrobiae bacterium]
MKPKLLIVDDDESIRSQMKWALEADYEIFLADNRANALELFKTRMPPVTLLDLGLPPLPSGVDEGFAVMSEMLAQNPAAKIIVITGNMEKSNAFRAIGAGAYDFLTKPVDIEELKIILKRTFYVATLEQEFKTMQTRFHAESFEGMLGMSPPMQEIFNLIRKVATTDAPVLILGESGTGKEIAALAIHRLSARREGPFVAINCTAIPETLLESELFGHEKGSFTGAHVQRKGRIENAAGGTLFLDEIGELPAPLQVKLLRFLQEQCIERIGGREEIRVDTRVIAATNSDLAKAIRQEKFREDLYYRLAVVIIRLPPLRDRENDVQLLAQDFLRRFAAGIGKKELTFDHEARRALSLYPWPGNVREMENRIKRAVIMAEGKHLTALDLELQDIVSARGTKLHDAREAVEREVIQKALRKYSGKMAPAAVELGISRPTLYELMDKLGLKRQSDESERAPA